MNRRTQNKEFRILKESAFSFSIPCSVFDIRNSRQRRAGFSILEVLVALAVFGIAAGGLLAVLGNHMRDVSYLKDQAQALRIARREMDSLQRMSSFQTLEESGEEGRFTWVSLMTDELPLEIPGEETGESSDVLAMLQVEVTWSESEGGTPSKRVRLQALNAFPEER